MVKWNNHISNQSIFIKSQNKLLFSIIRNNTLFFWKKFIILNRKKNKQTLKDDPLAIFQECSNFLYDFKIEPDKFHYKCANVTKLFCLGYIKSYCYKFIKMHDKQNFDPLEIIKEINKCDKINMIKL